jgi:hypothetical protein
LEAEDFQGLPGPTPWQVSLGFVWFNGRKGPNKFVRGKRKKRGRVVGHQWLIPVILATQEAEIRRIEVQS